MPASRPKEVSFYSGGGWYLLISTLSPQASRIARDVAAHLGLSGPAADDRAEPGAVCPLYMEVLNDVDGLPLDGIEPGRQMDGVDDAHSLVSLACLIDGEYTFRADFWGINTHYWFHDGNTFISSNNVIAVAAISNSGLSACGVYEALFFNVPLNCSWFDDVNCLRAGEKIAYNPARHSVTRSCTPVRERLRDLPARPLSGCVRDYFEKARDTLSGCDCYLCLSPGSDSRTVLSCMRNKDLCVRAVSFGCCDYRETAMTRKFVRRYGVSWDLVDLEGFEDEWLPLMRKGVVETNGMLNASRLHYFRFYGSVPQGAPIFEGILGSEFVKGEIAYGSMISECHHMVVVEGLSIADALRRAYPELPQDFRETAGEYLEDGFSDLLQLIETEPGRLAFLEYALENIPRKSFAGLALLGQKQHRMFYPFLSPPVVCSFFDSGRGLPYNNSLRSDFNYLRCVAPESGIVREMDHALYCSLLDRNITFKEAECCPARLLILKRKIRGLLNRMRYRGYRLDQVDNSKVNSLKKVWVMNDTPGVDVLPVEIREQSTYKLVDLLLNLHFLERTVEATGTAP